MKDDYKEYFDSDEANQDRQKRMLKLYFTVVAVIATTYWVSVQ